MGCLLLEIAVTPLRITFLQYNTPWLSHAVFALSPSHFRVHMLQSHIRP